MPLPLPPSTFIVADSLATQVGPTEPLAVGSGVLPVMPAPTVQQLGSGAGAAITYNIVPISASGVDGALSPTVTVNNNAATPNNQLSWQLFPGAAGGYRVIKNSLLLATVGPGVTTYLDNAGSAGTAYASNVVSTTATLPIPGSPAGQSTSAYGTATAPTINTAITTLSGLAAGNYLIEVYTEFGGTADSLGGNMELRVGSTVIGPTITDTGINGVPNRTIFRRVNVPASTNVTVNAHAGAGASSIYNALIVATPVN